ncbi:MAG: hypothetical protein ACI4ET_14450 [Bilifractor sp.]
MTARYPIREESPVFAFVAGVVDAGPDVGFTDGFGVGETEGVTLGVGVTVGESPTTDAMTCMEPLGFSSSSSVADTGTAATRRSSGRSISRVRTSSRTPDLKADI